MRSTLSKVTWLLSLLDTCTQCGADLCTPEKQTYEVTVTVSLPTPLDAAGAHEPEPSGARAKVLVWVSESSSVVACTNGLAQQASPGRSLLSQVRVDTEFTLSVPVTVYPRVGVPDIVLRILVDQNDNGRCDDGEAQATAVVERARSSTMHLTAVGGTCRRAL